MARESTIDVSYELETPVARSPWRVFTDWLRGIPAETEYVEHEFVMHYTAYGAEPDVGIFGAQIEDTYYTLDGKAPLPDDLQAAIDADDAWQERQLEAAAEAADEPDDDYPEYD